MLQEVRKSVAHGIPAPEAQYEGLLDLSEPPDLLCMINSQFRAKKQLTGCYK